MSTFMFILAKTIKNTRLVKVNVYTSWESNFTFFVFALIFNDDQMLMEKCSSRSTFIGTVDGILSGR